MPSHHRNYYQHLREFLFLALPIMVSEVGRVLLQSIDNVMVGQLGASSLAAILLANSLFWLPSTFGDGLCRGFVPIMAEAQAQKIGQRGGSLLQNAFLINTFFGFLLFTLTILSSKLLSYLNQDPQVVSLAIPYLWMISASLIPSMVFRTIEKYQHALLNPKPATYISFVGMGMNIVLNYCLIYGKCGLPLMGLTGAGLATLISRVVMALLAIVWLLTSSHARPHLQYFHWSRFSLPIIKQLFRLGIPASFQISIEVIAATASVIIVGWIGVEAQAINAIIINFSILIYVSGASIASAAAAKIGHYWGGNNIEMVKKMCRITFITSTGFLFIPALLLLLGKDFLPTLFTNDLSIQTGVSALIPVLLIFMVFDIFHTSAVGVLRGMQDATIPMWVTMIANWVVSIPVGLFFAFGMGWGIFGLWSGAIIAFALSTFILWHRIYRKVFSSQPVVQA